MKNIRIGLVLLTTLFSLSGWCKAQEEWPKTINTEDGTIIKIYQPEPESFSDNVLKARAAISVQTPDKTDPVFGTFWTVAKVETDRDNRRVIIQSATVPNIKMAGQTDDNMTADLKALLESQLPEVAGDLSLDELLSQLDMNQEQKKLSKDLNTTAPKIIYASRPSLLVLIDGAPKLQTNKDWNLDIVVNTPFTIVKNNDGQFYLYGGKHWYSAPAATGPYNPASNVPRNLRQVEQAVNDANDANAGYRDSAAVAQDNVVSDIIVSTKPAELIQTDGQPNFTPIEGTTLAYASNSSNDIFLDQNANKYYVLISGRWYSSPSLYDHWKYIASNALPADFAKIPEGSAKDNVLSSVAGTDAAREAVMDAQIPQTAKVDRSTASTNVQYNGDPRFQPIQGTDMQYAVNTSSSVLLDRGVYYTVDNGVWFQSTGGPNGPWVVCTDRPDDVDLIPPSCPLYNIKYVYVYDVTPDYVYMGYTPGYLNAYIYGPTVVYGTGFYYNPWFDGFYYARPWTWGFNMCYNPWAGWSIGYGYGFGWFNYGYGLNIGIGLSFGHAWGGWWGPRVYHPPYVWNQHRNYGFYGHNFYRNQNVRARNYRTNIYVNRAGIATHNYRPFVNNRTNGARPGFGTSNPGRLVPINNGSARPGFNINNRNPQNQNQPGVTRQNNRPTPLTPTNNNPQPQPQRTPNNVFSDRNGNVFQRNQNNQWQQRQQNQWRPVQNNNQAVQNLNREQQMRDRGQMRTQNFERARNTAPAAAPQRSFPVRPAAPAPSGGGGNHPNIGGRGNDGRHH